MSTIAPETYERSIRHFLGPVLPLLDDPTVTEVLINGPSEVYAERAGRLTLSGLSFPGAAMLRAAVLNIAEYVDRPLDDGHPTLDARLPNGSRVHVVLPPCSRQGICVSIRKFVRASFSLDFLKSCGFLTPEATEFLGLAVLLKKTIVISGATDTGKTSLLNALSAEIPNQERIIVIEDNSELRLSQPHTVYLEARPARPDGLGQVTILDLFVASLRMRPDRILIGEVRRGEALDVIQSMISGHAGTLTTIHARDSLAAATRLETLCMMSDVSLPAHVAKTLVSQALEVVVQLTRDTDGTRRVTSISDIEGLGDDGQYKIRELFRFQGRGRDRDGMLHGDLCLTGLRPSFASLPYELGYGDRVQLCGSLFMAPDRVGGLNGDSKESRNPHRNQTS
jgi:pilus assembly protein CpaF